MSEKSPSLLTDFVSSAEHLVTYTPLSDEVNPSSYMPFPPERIYVIRPDATLDPIEELKAVGNNEDAVICVPGTRFDEHGTRHGRGGGWYDRFLAHTPPSWGRVGFCFDDQFVEDALPREVWDEPVDYVVVVNRDTGSFRLYETGARPGILPA